MSQACAEIVRRDDPRLWRTALFAPEPARSRLMVLYAFDCELSRAARAARASSESLIPRMRLQWWRDVIQDAAVGRPPKAHEIAAPLASLVSSQPRSRAMWLAMIDGHEAAFEAPFKWPEYRRWAELRFATRLCLAVNILTNFTVQWECPFEFTPVEQSQEELCLTSSLRELGQAVGTDLALRHAARMAAIGKATLLPAVVPEDLAALGRGQLGKIIRTDIATLVTRHIATIGLSRSVQLAQDQRAIPGFLPFLWTERTLRLVAKDPAAIFGQLDDIDRPFDGLRLAWRVWRGRW